MTCQNSVYSLPYTLFSFDGRQLSIWYETVVRCNRKVRVNKTLTANCITSIIQLKKPYYYSNTVLA